MNDLKILVLQQWSHPLILTLLIALFYLLTLSTQHGYTLRFDQSILTWFHHVRTPWLDTYFSTITWMGSLWLLIPLYLGYIILYGSSNPVMGKMVTLIFWGTIITTYTLKYLLERKRPHFFGPLHELPIDPSFPSAHSAQIAAFTIGVGLCVFTSNSEAQNTILTVLVLIALSVFASRIYLQVHFPTDIIAGVMVALAWTTIALWIIKTGTQQ